MTSLMVSLKSKNTESRISPEILAGAVSFKVGTRNAHHKKKEIDTYSVVAMATPLAPVHFYEKLNIPILHFVSFVMYISDAKFKGQCFNISRDTMYS